MSSNVPTFRNNGPEGMDPDGVIEVGAFVSSIINIIFSNCTSLLLHLFLFFGIFIPDQLEYSGGQF